MDETFPAALLGGFYGRREQITQLRSLQLARANDTSPNGRRPVVLVNGTAGVGKTELIQRAYSQSPGAVQTKIVTGKADQLLQSHPYIAVAKALESLLAQILSRSAEQVQHIRQMVVDQLEEKVAVLCELAPSLITLFGAQKQSPVLGPAQATVRLQNAFNGLLVIVGEQLGGLVLFIDDLQWIDKASMDLLRGTVEELSANLLFVGAYRTAEIDDNRIAKDFLQYLHGNEKLAITQLEIKPLHQPVVKHWLDDTALLVEDGAKPLALSKIVWQKTRGNPFFIRQFIAAACGCGAIKQQQNGQWRCHLVSLEAMGSTDNVIALLVVRLKRLPPSCKQIISLAAAIGNQFFLGTLATIAKITEQDAKLRLVPAIQEGLVSIQAADLVHHNETHMAFGHDRIQRAAYELTLPAARPALHLHIGHLLMARAATLQTRDPSFAIAFHLAAGRTLIKTAEIPDWLNWTLAAAAKAIESSAYHAASQYLADCQSGLNQLLDHTADSGLSQQEGRTIAFRYWQQCFDAHYCLGELEKSAQAIDLARGYANDKWQHANLNLKQMLQTSAQGDFSRARQCGIDTLALLQFDLPQRSDRATIESLWNELQLLLNGREIADLNCLPVTSNRTDLLVAEVLMRLGPSSFAGEPDWFPVVCLSSVNHALRSGNCAHSASGYVMLAIWLGHESGYSNEMADQFGKLGLELARSTGDPSSISMCAAIYGALVSHWRYPFAFGENIAQQGYDIGLSGGELLWGSYSLQLKSYLQVARSASLVELQRELDGHRDIASRWGNTGTKIVLVAYQLAIENLLGLTASNDTYTYLGFDEGTIIQMGGSSAYLFVFESMRAQARFIYGHFELALQSCEVSYATEKWCRGSVLSPENRFFYAMTKLALAETEQSVSATCKGSLRYLKLVATDCRENYLHLYLLLSASYSAYENCAVDKTVALYEQAIQAASDVGALKYVAIGHEQLGYYFASLSQHNRFVEQLKLSMKFYQRWGALRKASLLRLKLGQRFELFNTRDDLLHELLAYCAADRVVFLVRTETGIRAFDYAASVHDLAAMLYSDANIGAYVPVSVVNYVLNSGLSVSIAANEINHEFSTDRFFSAVHDKNVLCLPQVRKDGEIVAIYIESKHNSNLLHLYQSGNLDFLVSNIQDIGVLNSVADNLPKAVPVQGPG